ncbi:MAG TPA: hypothetical protein DDW65_02330 [Firmicutes bacterium]|nr:hypothetical protein [Bacillota bacterium]
MGDEYSEIDKKFRHQGLRLSNILRVLGGLLALIFIIELVGILVGNLTIKPVVAKWGTMEKGFWADALFLRDETPLIAPEAGELKLLQSNGIRVPLGEVAAAVTPNDFESTEQDNSNLQLRLQDLNRDISSLQADLERITRENTAKKAKLGHLPKNSLQGRSIKEDLTTIEQEKAITLRNIEHDRSEFQSLTTKMNNQKSGKALITVTKPGYLFYQYDDWETRLSPARAHSLTARDFERSYSSRTPDRQVNTGMVVGKIVQPFHQVIAVIANPKQTGIPAPGTSWWYKNGERTYQCPIVKQLQLADDQIIVAMDDAAMLPEYMPERRAKIFVIYKYITGITVPVQALYNKDGRKVVRVVKGDGYKETKVVVRENDGVKAIINGIEFGTTIISR